MIGTSPLRGTWKYGQHAHTGENQRFGSQAHLAGPVVEDPAPATRHNHGDGHQGSGREQVLAFRLADGLGHRTTGNWVLGARGRESLSLICFSVV